MKPSLWDLKLTLRALTRVDCVYHEAIPMGFETSNSPCQCVDQCHHEAIPMGFETLNVAGKISRSPLS